MKLEAVRVGGMLFALTAIIGAAAVGYYDATRGWWWAVPIHALIGLAGVAIYLMLSEAPLLARPRRWFLWTCRCRRGRGCAKAVFAGPVDPDEEMPPPGSVLLLEYACGGCGTVYRTEAVLNGDTFTQTEPERIA